jgi:hypothetical protein
MSWILLLNDMRMAHYEQVVPVCQAESKEALKAFLMDETVAPYMDGSWGKNFRSQGPLEWYNPPYEHDDPKHFLQVPPCVMILGCIEFREPQVHLPTIEVLLTGCPPYNRLERVLRSDP